MEKDFLIVIYESHKFNWNAAPGWDITGCYQTESYTYDIPVKARQYNGEVDKLLRWLIWTDAERLFHRKRAIHELL
jgi:hypothetical protein